MRLVSAWTRVISASCSSEVMPGLSLMTSLPWRIAAMRAAARSAGMPDERISAMDGSSSNLAAIGDALGLRIFRREGRGEIVLGGMKADELGAGAQQAIDLAIDVGVIDADRGETQFAHDFFSLVSSPCRDASDASGRRRNR